MCSGCVVSRVTFGRLSARHAFVNCDAHSKAHLQHEAVLEVQQFAQELRRSLVQVAGRTPYQRRHGAQRRHVGLKLCVVGALAQLCTQQSKESEMQMRWRRVG
jgi:hypothetical protein